MTRGEGNQASSPFFMRLTLTRTDFNSDCVIGTLAGLPTSIFTLELPSINGLPGSAIPPGIYPIVLAPSPKFMASQDPWILRHASKMPHIIRIPMRTEIMLHWGNHPSDTDGCVLVGMDELGPNLIGQSRMAFELLMSTIETPAEAGDCDIHVIGGAAQPTT